jgi:hypothetical protein
VAPVAELHSLWADLGTVSENVEHALPQLQAVCDTVGQAMEALQTQDDRLTKLHQSVGKLQQSWSRRRAGSAGSTRPSPSSRSGPASWTRSSRRSRGAPR